MNKAQLQRLDAPVIDRVMATQHFYRDKWRAKNSGYWFMRLSQEMGELAGVLAGDHDDSMEWELIQIASICINWLRLMEQNQDEPTTV